MKKIFTVVLFVISLFSLAACGSSNIVQENNPQKSLGAMSTQENKPSANVNKFVAKADSTMPVNDGKSQTGKKGGKTLVAYFSRVGSTNFAPNVDVVSSATLNSRNGQLVGNNKIIADMIVDLTGGDLFLIQTVNPYPSNYRETTNVAKDEMNANARPKLATHVKNMEEYDVIILGYPNWWGTIPMALFTFLEEYDFSGKTIAPFSTHEGSGLGSGVSDIKKLAPNAKILDGLAIRGSNVSGAQKDVADWLNKLKLAK